MRQQSLRRISALLALTVVASAAIAAGPAAAAPKAAKKAGASGNVIIEGLTLAGTQYGTPSGMPTTETTDALTLPVTDRDRYHYSTITCQSPFPPWNNVGLHFTPDYPGITDPASVRHEFEGTVRKVNRAGHGTVEGTIRTYLCVTDPVTGQLVRGDQIATSYKANFRPTSDTSVALQSNPVPTKGGIEFKGNFRVTGGTGRFADLTGHGSITGQFTRLGTRPGTPESLTPPGYSEVPFQLAGTYRDPTA